MERISIPLSNIQDFYDVVVIGSGYGGSIAASRLARAGKRVCLLERGREILSGEYPDTPIEAAGQLQAHLPNGTRLGRADALYDFKFFNDINVFQGCGLGGTSLINANVSLRADPRVFDDPCWPEDLRKDVHLGLEQAYKLAEQMLKPVPYPNDWPLVNKLKAMDKSAKQLNAQCTRPPINVNFLDKGVNHVGVEQSPCTLCGDCISGCNDGAKNTTLMNYLPDARNHGAEIYTGIDVQYVQHAGEQWIIYFKIIDSGRDLFAAPPVSIKAALVVLAGGTLGSTEILLRSREKGLQLSDQLGEHFTGNGDVLGFGYNADQAIDSIGWGNKSHTDPDNIPVGPCISGLIDLRDTPQWQNGMLIEEGSLPGAVNKILPAMFANAAKIFGKDTDDGVVDLIKEKTRELDSLVRGAYHGAVKHTQTFLVMSHDDSHGRMELKDDHIHVSWPGVGKQAIFATVNEKLFQATQGIGGTFVHNPIWNRFTDRQLISVHPLGGCAMAAVAEKGVVNHKCQVFAANQGEAVYANLLVCDGSVIPRSVGVNPLLTISALTERACQLLAKDHKWKINYQLPSKPPAARPVEKMGIQFTETMKGYFSTAEQDDYVQGDQRGKQDRSTFEFILTITSEDLDAMLGSSEHQATMMGTVQAPALSPVPLTASGGKFNLLIDNKLDIATQNMRYQMKLNAQDGSVYFFEGFKTIRKDGDLELWSDTTTLYITLYKGADAAAPVLGKGILHIEADDFLRQMQTMRVTGTADTMQRLNAMSRFGRFFAGRLYDIYGGVFAKPDNSFFADAPPRKKRPLRTAAPQFYPFQTDDNVALLLTRYQGGNKGPVMFSHGLGVSSRIFSIDTIETNLLEFLYNHGYDCWLLDYRASIDLAASKQLSTGDSVATLDYPAAIKTILSKTGLKELDVVAHCFGSTTFIMAMLAGLQGVRSAVCSQVATHMVSPTLTKIKTGLYFPELLDAIGVESLTADAKKNQPWWDKAFDKALKLFPGNYSDNNPVSRRITFLYGPLYELAQLNRATYSALHELFGIANIDSFKHLANMVRSGHVVDAENKDVYLPHLERLKIPITFIHGSENKCFYPQSTEITFKLLTDKISKTLYQRHVIAEYGHIDCIFGKNAIRDVYPFILQHLEKINQGV